MITLEMFSDAIREFINRNSEEIKEKIIETEEEAVYDSFHHSYFIGIKTKPLNDPRQWDVAVYRDHSGYFFVQLYGFDSNELDIEDNDFLAAYLSDNEVYCTPFEEYIRSDGSYIEDAEGCNVVDRETLISRMIEEDISEKMDGIEADAEEIKNVYERLSEFEKVSDYRRGNNEDSSEYSDIEDGVVEDF